jgi:predicted SnoaL-like aldol condensation-catalyzing enzyme
VSDVERNKQVVVDYYQTAFNGDPEKAIADHFGPRYIQHNPDAADGPEAFISYVRWLRGEYPNLKLDIKRVIAEGDMVVTHSHLDLEPGNADNPGRALADFFRLEDGKLASGSRPPRPLPEIGMEIAPSWRQCPHAGRAGGRRRI